MLFVGSAVFDHVEHYCSVESTNTMTTMTTNRHAPFTIQHAFAQPDWGVCLSAGLSLSKPSEGESWIMKYLRRFTRFESSETQADKDANIADVLVAWSTFGKVDDNLATAWWHLDHSL